MICGDGWIAASKAEAPIPRHRPDRITVPDPSIGPARGISVDPAAAMPTTGGARDIMPAGIGRAAKRGIIVGVISTREGHIGRAARLPAEPGTTGAGTPPMGFAMRGPAMPFTVPGSRIVPVAGPRGPAGTSNAGMPRGPEPGTPLTGSHRLTGPERGLPIPPASGTPPGSERPGVPPIPEPTVTMSMDGTRHPESGQQDPGRFPSGHGRCPGLRPPRNPGPGGRLNSLGVDPGGGVPAGNG